MRNHWAECICIAYLTDVSLEDSGNYTCEIRGRKSTVLTHVTHIVHVRCKCASIVDLIFLTMLQGCYKRLLRNAYILPLCCLVRLTSSFRVKTESTSVPDSPAVNTQFIQTSKWVFPKLCYNCEDETLRTNTRRMASELISHV
jgi:hypothetical protein